MMVAVAAADIPKLTYQPLSVDPRGAFSCSVPEIDKWFKRCLDKHKRFANRVTTVHYDGSKDIVAFYALSMKLESTRMLTSTDRKSWGRFSQSEERFICLNFDYVAVAKKHQGRGIGKLVVARVIEEFARVASATGVEIMTGSAINKEKFEFYKALGFLGYGHATEAPQMYLPALSALEMAGME